MFGGDVNSSIKPGYSPAVKLKLNENISIE